MFLEVKELVLKIQYTWFIYLNAAKFFPCNFLLLSSSVVDLIEIEKFELLAIS